MKPSLCLIHIFYLNIERLRFSASKLILLKKHIVQLIVFLAHCDFAFVKANDLGGEFFALLALISFKRAQIRGAFVRLVSALYKRLHLGAGLFGSFTQLLCLRLYTLDLGIQHAVFFLYLQDFAFHCFNMV